MTVAKRSAKSNVLHMNRFELVTAMLFLNLPLRKISDKVSKEIKVDEWRMTVK
jgi:hypothetical protein